MFALAALYVMLDAQFVGTMQVLVYAGAIMVVFLFVVMLLNLGQPAELADIRGTFARIAAGGVGIALVAEVMTLATGPLDLRLIVPNVPAPVVLSGPAGVIGPIAAPMFKEYLLAFELTSVLLLVAIIGAVVIGKKGR
jgi:NADH-quinone oxidoreductase subunit J